MGFYWTFTLFAFKTSFYYHWDNRHKSVLKWEEKGLLNEVIIITNQNSFLFLLHFSLSLFWRADFKLWFKRVTCKHMFLASPALSPAFYVTFPPSGKGDTLPCGWSGRVLLRLTLAPHPGLVPLAQISTCSASPERQQEDRDNQNMSGRCMSAGNQRTGKQGKDMWANGPSPGRMGRGCNQKGPIVSQPMAEQRARVCLLFEGALQEAQEQNKFPKCLRGARGWVRFSRISSFP